MYMQTTVERTQEKRGRVLFLK